MKNISLHTPSLLVGIGLAVLVGVAMSQQSVTGPTVDVRVIEPVANYPHGHPRDFVRIVEGQAYVVPVGQQLVVTALGSSKMSTGITTNLNVNGVNECAVYYVSPPAGTTVQGLPEPGVVATSGDTVNVGGGGASNDDARAWGDLVDA